MFTGEPFVTSPSFTMQPGSPDSLMSGLSSAAPIYRIPPPPQLVQSSSTSTTNSMMSSSSAAYLNETIAKASALPESFYPEFLQYSKESFEQQSPNHNNKKRNRLEDEDKKTRQFTSSSSSSSSDEDDDEERPSRKQKTE